MLATVSVWPTAAIALGGFLVLVGIGHLLAPAYFETLVPPWPWLPDTRRLVLVSGVFEAVVGLALFLETTRRTAAWMATALMVVYVATHVDALLRSSADRRRWLDRPTGAVARVLVNLAYLAWATGVALRAAGTP